jgi:PAS domain S-box-containing protein
MRKQKLLSKRLYKKYVFAVIATAACLYGQYLMLPVFGAMQYFLLFPLVFIAAALGGFGPALVVIGMGGVGAHVLLADPAARMGLHYPSWLALIKFFIFAFSTLVGSWIVHLIQEKQQFLLKNIDVLRESDKQFKMLADTSPVLIWMTNLEKNTTWFNKGWQVFTGLSLDECLSLNIESLIHPDDLHVVLTTFNKSFDQREEFRIEYRLRNAEGIYRWVLCNSVPMYNGDEFCGYIGVCVDINDHKESEEKIKKALFSRDQFLAVASHELKTPIASLTLQAQVFKKMMEKNNDEIPKDKVLMISDQMTRSAMRLTKLIDDVLDNSRINSGKFHMNPEECDLTEIVESVINNLKIQFANAKTGSPVIDYKTDLHDVDAYKVRK